MIKIRRGDQSSEERNSKWKASLMLRNMEARAENYRYEARQAFNMDERIASLFEPDTLLSAQYFEELRRKTLLEPERRLMLAILEDAITCYQDNLLARRSKASRLFSEAQQWVLEQSSDWIFSFENICETLGFNPACVRQGLLRWREKKTAKYVDSNYREGKRIAR